MRKLLQRIWRDVDLPETPRPEPVWTPSTPLITELVVGRASGPPPVLHHATSYQWAAACHELWEAGRIDVLEYAVRALQPHYPQLTYLETLLALFEEMPRAEPAPLEFCDNPAAEVQIVRRRRCDAVLLCFCACQGTLGLPVNFIHQWLGRLPVSLVYLKDLRNLAGGCGFPTLGPDRQAAVAALQRIIRKLRGKRVYTLGVSLGGFAALHYGLALGADAVLNMAGATDFTPEFVASAGTVPPEYLEIQRLAPDYAVNLRDSYESATRRPRALIAYSAGHPRDRIQAERMAGLREVEVIAVDFAQHNVLEPLIRQRLFMPLLQRLVGVAGTPA